MIKNIPIEDGSNNDTLKMELNRDYITKLNMMVKENSFVKKDQKIGEYFINDIKSYIMSPMFGKILKIDLEDKHLILEKCHHDKTYYSLCIECGFNFRK